jgi:uncharacterized RDD family membrane protein YckC
MKCPKCDYLGFETGDRCKNCGYDFSLLAVPAREPADLALTQPARDDVPIGDLWLDSAATKPSSAGSASSPIESFPLFSPAGEDYEPLIKTPSEPRAPLSVRRAPELSRSRTAVRTPRAFDSGLTLQFAEEAPELPSTDTPQSETPFSVRSETVVIHPSSGASPLSTIEAVASLGSRTVAAVIDHAILLGIDVVVFYSTLRMTALTTDDWRALPLVPFVAFLVLVKLAYFAAFTALGGQTIGKMAAGIRVVADDQLVMDPARAIKRTLTSAVSLASFGLGLIPALIGPDRRALHDRVAHTHVIDLPSA